MNVSLVLWTSFMALVGLQLCVPENPNGRFEAEFNEKYWTHNPLLRIFYGLSNILGVIFVLGMVGYLTFTEHWWYLGVYVGGLILAKLIALLLRLLLYPLYRLTNDIPTFAEIKVQRIVGSLMVLVGIVLFLCFKLLLSAKHDLPMPNLFITSGWAYLCFMTSPLIRFPYRQEVLQMPVQA